MKGRFEGAQMRLLPEEVYERVQHALEGEEIFRQKLHLADGTERIVEAKTFGPQRWIKRVHERRIVTPTELLAVILFALWDFRDTSQDDLKIISGWLRALDGAIERGDIRPRDRDSLLPTPAADSFEWVLSLDDADAFVAAQGMGWTCTEIAAHLFNEFFPEPPVEATEPSDVPIASGPRFESRRGDAPFASNAEPVVHRHTRDKARRNILDPAFDRAIATAGSEDTAAVFLALKEAALIGEAPFTGEVTDGKLFYTTDDDRVDYLTKERLRHRLRPRKRANGR
jgi:hypothetical protein